MLPFITELLYSFKLINRKFMARLEKLIYLRKKKVINPFSNIRNYREND